MNWRGSEGLRQFVVPIESIRPNPENARKHRKDDLKEIARSLEEHGQQRAVVVNTDGMLLAGEGRWRAAQAIGWTHIAVLRSDIEDPTKQDLYAIRDNRTAELSEWDRDMLSDTIKYLNDNVSIEPIRPLWAPPELDALLEVTWTPPSAAELPQYEEKQKGADDAPSMAKAIVVSPETWTVFSAAAAKLRKAEEAASMSNGRALELMVADWMS